MIKFLVVPTYQFDQLPVILSELNGFESGEFVGDRLVPVVEDAEIAIGIQV